MRQTTLWFFLHPSPIVFLVFLVLYTFTLAPGLLPADSGEYQVTGAVLGVAHPPGFALYTLARWLISRAPGIPPAAAINFLSALLAAGALALLSRAVRGLTGSALAGVGAAALLGLSTTFWAQATTANIRMPAAAATLFALDRLLAYRQTLTADNKSPQVRALAWHDKGRYWAAIVDSGRESSIVVAQCVDYHGRRKWFAQETLRQFCVAIHPAQVD